jgi:Uma2 family endonuclease
MISPSYNHGYVQAKLARAFLELKKYAVVSELTLTIEGKDYVPDIVLYPSRPISWVNDASKMSDMPLLAAEILSPTQSAQEIIDKFKIYFQAGVRSCWLIEWVPNVVMVFSAPDTMRSFFEGDIVDQTLELSLPIKEIFS